MGSLEKSSTSTASALVCYTNMVDFLFNIRYTAMWPTQGPVKMLYFYFQVYYEQSLFRSLVHLSSELRINQCSAKRCLLVPSFCMVLILFVCLLLFFLLT